MVHGPVNAKGDLGCVTPAAGVEHLHRHDFWLPGHPGNAHGVVRLGRRDPGHVCPITMVIVRKVIVVNEVVTGYEFINEIDVAERNTGIDDCDGHAAATNGKVPRIRSFDLPEVPLVVVVREVVRQHCGGEGSWLMGGGQQGVTAARNSDLVGYGGGGRRENSTERDRDPEPG